MAKSTVERLMRRNGWQGVRRQKSVRTTIADPAAERAGAHPERVGRGHFTYVKLVSGRSLIMIIGSMNRWAMFTELQAPY